MRGEGPPRQAAGAAFSISRVEKVDLLFVVDNSNSMAGEQASLRAQLPHLMDVLTRGERGPDDPRPFTPVRDLHVGVVSTDMGIPGVEFASGNCHADGGDDGRLQHTPQPDPASGLTCDASYPAFLASDAAQDPAQIAHDVACVAALGTGGCGFESQLEAGFKALWPRDYTNAAGELVQPNPYRFISITEEGTWGRGDGLPQAGGNRGFLRDDSLLAIVLLTDEEDCSVSSTQHLKPNNQLPQDSPYRMQDINLRCYLNKQFLYDVRERYLVGLRKLRPGREDLVVFSAIVGVPADLVSPEALREVDFSDTAARDAFYDGILHDERMQEQPDPSTNPGSGQGNLKPSCVRAVSDGVPSTAYPPRRIVELAKLFGENGMVQSICQDDFAPALESIVETMAKPLGEMCMAQRLQREADGRVDCKMYWELPPASLRTSTVTPVECAELGDLVEPGAVADDSASGGRRCEIHQLAVRDGNVRDGKGWYYDDFTDGLDRLCAGNLSRRIAFTAGVRAPQGVSVKVDCSADAAADQ
jgi:hypothetical protein